MATRSDVLRLDIDVRNQRANRELDKFARKSEQAAGRSRQAFGRVTTSVNNLRNVLYLGGAAALATGGVAALDRIAERAASITNLSRAFGQLTTELGTTRHILGTIRPAAQGFVSDLELMRFTNQGLLLGLPLTAESMAELTDASVKLSRAMGIDVTRGLESLIVGIGRQSRLWLDNLGIVVDAEAANRRMAASLGKKKSELTETERKLAFYNATLDAARVRTASLGEATDTLSDKWDRLKTSIANATNAFLNWINRPSRGRAGGMLGMTPGADVAAALRFPITQNLLQSGFEALPRNATSLQVQRQLIPHIQSLLGFGIGRLPAAQHPLSPLGVPIAPFGATNIPGGVGDVSALMELNEQFSRLQELQSQGLLTNQQYSESMAVLTERGMELAELGLKPAWLQMQNVTAATEEMGLTALQTSEKYQHMAALVLQAGAAMFQGNKAFAIAAAIVDTWAAANRALREGGPFAGPALASAIIAMGLANVRRIQSTNPGSGIAGGGGFGGGGFATPTGFQAGNNQRPVEITIIIEGSGSNSEEIARETARQVERQMRRAGARG